MFGFGLGFGLDSVRFWIVLAYVWFAIDFG